MIKGILFISLLLFLLSGCVTTMSQVDRIAGASQPYSYKLGFQNGYDSGVAAAGNPYYRFNKDIDRYNNSGIYRQGWDDGYDYGKAWYSRLGR